MGLYNITSHRSNVSTKFYLQSFVIVLSSASTLMTNIKTSSLLLCHAPLCFTFNVGYDHKEADYRELFLDHVCFLSLRLNPALIDGALLLQVK